jgi:hypothetical protein
VRPKTGRPTARDAWLVTPAAFTHGAGVRPLPLPEDQEFMAPGVDRPIWLPAAAARVCSVLSCRDRPWRGSLDRRVVAGAAALEGNRVRTQPRREIYG